MISISPSAAVHLRALLAEHTPSDATVSSDASGGSLVRRGLRIQVEKGGCAGLQYTMNLSAERPGDLVGERDGVYVFIDLASSAYLSGSTLDYCDDLVGTGFRLENPNAARSCGCGTSFEPATAVEGVARENPEAATSRLQEEGSLGGR